MSPMLEKAASAVHDVPREKGDAFDVGDVAARNIARAVLLAIREPDADMTEFLLTSMEDGLGIWNEAIDAILAGETET